MPIVPSRRNLLSPLATGILTAALILGACTEPTSIAPELTKGGAAAPLTVVPVRLLLRSPGSSKTFIATVQYSGALTASSSNPACATVSPTTTPTTEKPAGSSVYVAQFTVTPVGAGGCTITVTDKKGNAVTVRVSVSPIAFHSDRDGNIEIYVMEADGQYPTRLTNNDALDARPDWSPDGARIAFISDREGPGDSEIYSMDADGQNPTRLTNTSASEGDPKWSPDGTKLAFLTDRDGNTEIYVMDADGQHQTRLTDNSALDGDPSWSPDGSKIAFWSQRDTPNGEIYVMDADGQNVTRLTNNTDADFNPAWSPDGTRIAFVNDGAGLSWEIWVMDPDGQNPTRLTNNDFTDEGPAWSPDGARIAFARREGTGEREIYAMDADGGNETRLTSTASPLANNQDPAWR
jgi:Tol biopolymer transport system component